MEHIDIDAVLATIAVEQVLMEVRPGFFNHQIRDIASQEVLASFPATQQGEAECAATYAEMLTPEQAYAQELDWQVRCDLAAEHRAEAGLRCIGA
jgi:hypothetical protein